MLRLNCPDDPLISPHPCILLIATVRGAIKLELVPPKWSKGPLGWENTHIRVGYFEVHDCYPLMDHIQAFAYKRRVQDFGGCS